MTWLGDSYYIVTTGYNKQSNREVVLRDIRNVGSVVHSIVADNVRLAAFVLRRAPGRSSPSTTPRATFCGTPAAATRSSTDSTSTTPPCGPIEVSTFPRFEDRGRERDRDQSEELGEESRDAPAVSPRHLQKRGRQVSTFPPFEVGSCASTWRAASTASRSSCRTKPAPPSLYAFSPRFSSGNLRENSAPRTGAELRPVDPRGRREAPLPRTRAEFPRVGLAAEPRGAAPALPRGYFGFSAGLPAAAYCFPAVLSRPVGGAARGVRAGTGETRGRHRAAAERETPADGGSPRGRRGDAAVGGTAGPAGARGERRGGKRGFGGSDDGAGRRFPRSRGSSVVSRRCSTLLGEASRRIGETG